MHFSVEEAYISCVSLVKSCEHRTVQTADSRQQTVHRSVSIQYHTWRHIHIRGVSYSKSLTTVRVHHSGVWTGGEARHKAQDTDTGMIQV